MVHLVLLLAVLLPLTATAQAPECYEPKFAGEVPGLALDVCEINALLDGGPDYKAAQVIYEEGKNALPTTLQQVASAEFPTDTYQKFAVFFGDDAWMDSIISDALTKQGFYANKNDVQRVQVIKKLLQSSVLLQLFYFHVDSAVLKAQAGNGQGALKSLDKAMAAFYGLDDDCAPYGNGNARGVEFDTMNEDGISLTNLAVYNALVQGIEAMSGDLTTEDVDSLLDARRKMIAATTIIYLQAVLKYSNLMDVGIETEKPITKAQAEGFAYYHAIYPTVGGVDPNGAEEIFNTFNIDFEGKDELVDRVKPIVTATFGLLGVTAEEVGEFDGTRVAAQDPTPETKVCGVINPFTNLRVDTLPGDADR